MAAALTDVYEQWDGRGGARGLRGEAIAQPARIAQVAVTAALFHRTGGEEAAAAALARRSGAALDPGLVEVVLHRRGRSSPCSTRATRSPPPSPPSRRRRCSSPSAGLDRVCRAFGEAVDLKTPLHHGHATGVAELAAAAAGQRRPRRGRRGRAAARGARARPRAGVGAQRHLGAPGPLSWAEQERVRLHAYHSERVLSRCGPLRPLAAVAGLHHERLDGSGYHRGARAAALPVRPRACWRRPTPSRR